MAAAEPPQVAIVGAGPAGLMAAEVISQGGLRVAVYDAMPSAGRKLLMAGRGGLNLTHSEPFDAFLTRYRGAAGSLAPALSAFSPDALRAWCEALGQPTFVGTSGRVFPQAMKASPLLRAWLRRLEAAGVAFHFRHRWRGWSEDGALLFETPDGERAFGADATVLALGGASWPRLGSNGAWTSLLAAKAIGVRALRPANCGFRVAWSDHFMQRHEGQPLKGIALQFHGRTVRGEAVITREGLEGGAVYALSAELRDALETRNPVILAIDLHPDLGESDIATRLSRPRGSQSLSTFLRKTLSLAPAATGLLNECARAKGIALATLDADELARFVRRVPVRVIAPTAIERAISSAGGVRFEAVNAQFMLREHPGIFVAGEMLDWEAPTGGYLLQACFATGVAAGQGVLSFLKNRTAQA